MGVLFSCLKGCRRLGLVAVGFVFASSANAAELLVSSYFGNTVGRFNLADGSFLGNYSGGSLSGPLGMTLGPDGLLYTASETANQIVRYNPSTHALFDVFIDRTGLNHPTSVTFDSLGNVLVGNFDSSTVSKYNSAGVYQGDLVSGGSNGLNGPDVGTVIGPDGNLYVPSFNSGAILEYNGSTGAFIKTFIAAGSNGLTQPRTILWHNGKIYVTSDNGNKVLRYNLDGTPFDTFVSSGSGGLSGASGMLFGDDGLLYVSSWRNNLVLRYNGTTGASFDTFISTGLNGPTFIAAVPEPLSLGALGYGLLMFRRGLKKRKA